MSSPQKPQGAGAFDIRRIIAALMGVYGLVITVMGIGVTSDEEIAKSAGVNINLWAGIGMLIFSALFFLWAWLRPIKVDESAGTDQHETEQHETEQHETEQHETEQREGGHD